MPKDVSNDERATISIRRVTRDKVKHVTKKDKLKVNIGDFCDAIISDWVDKNWDKPLDEIVKELMGEQG